MKIMSVITAFVLIAIASVNALGQSYFYPQGYSYLYRPDSPVSQTVTIAGTSSPPCSICGIVSIISYNNISITGCDLPCAGVQPCARD